MLETVLPAQAPLVNPEEHHCARKETRKTQTNKAVNVVVCDVSF
jgi:hypothetical protein